MESCDDPPYLHNNPINLTRLIDPGVNPPLMPKYYLGCNLIVQFHIMCRTVLANNMYERCLILSSSLPDSAFPNQLPSNQIQDKIWPDSYQYKYASNSGRTTRVHETIWQAHRLKAIPTNSDPVLL